MLQRSASVSTFKKLHSCFGFCFYNSYFNNVGLSIATEVLGLLACLAFVLAEDVES